ncbi:MAG TPA: hypothetical protein VGQ84_11135 [Gaiellaceae bacterium]|nr:hypothetical protein [Gaiellaceae bacterium]
MEHERDWPLDVVVAALRADVRHLAAEVADLRIEMRADIRRLDERLFLLLIAQLATLATALGALFANLAS